MSSQSPNHLLSNLIRKVGIRKQKAWLMVSATAVLLSAGVPAASADVYVSTLGNTVAPDRAVPIGGPFLAGFTFTTDNQSYTLDGITGTIDFQEFASPNENLGGRLYTSNSNGLPGLHLSGYSFSNSPLSEGIGDITFTPDSTLVLAANTSYTFIFIPTMSVFAEWQSTATSTGYTNAPGSSWDMPAVITLTTDGGATWLNAYAGDNRLLASVQATAIPEPGSVFLLAVSGLGALALRQRRRA